VEIINKIYKNIPDANITSDVIVGFPTESEKDFNDTLKVLKKAKRGALIFTSSCTSVVSMEMFAEIITKAIRDSRKDVNIIKKTSLPADHSSLLNFNETEYLKSFLLHVN